MQPMRTPAHAGTQAGTVGPEAAGTPSEGPVHGTRVPAPRVPAEGRPADEAIAEFPDDAVDAMPVWYTTMPPVGWTDHTDDHTDKMSSDEPAPVAAPGSEGSAADMEPADMEPADREPVDDDGDDDPETVTAHGDAGDLFDTDEFDDEFDDAGYLGDELETVDVEAEDALGDGPAVGVAPRRPGDIEETRMAVWTEQAAQSLRDEWQQVKAQFVDEPQAALAAAQTLVTNAVHTLTENLLAERVALDPRRHDDIPDTESMRVAMRHYQAFLHRVLTL